MSLETCSIELRSYWGKGTKSHELFPVVYVFLDGSEVLYLSYFTDKQQREGLPLSDALQLLNKVVKADKWQIEKDVSLRRSEILGTLNLIKVKEIENGMVL